MNQGYVVLINKKEPHEFETRKEALAFSKTLKSDQLSEMYRFTHKCYKDKKLVYTTDSVDILDIDTFAEAFYKFE